MMHRDAGSVVGRSCAAASPAATTSIRVRIVSKSSSATGSRHQTDTVNLSHLQIIEKPGLLGDGPAIRVIIQPWRRPVSRPSMAKAWCAGPKVAGGVVRSSAAWENVWRPGHERNESLNLACGDLNRFMNPLSSSGR